jgi:hypothetical protein
MKLVPDPEYHHHLGFFLRTLLGPTLLWAHGSAGAGSFTPRGTGFGLELAIGGALSEDLILFGEVVTTGAEVRSDAASGSDQFMVGGPGLGLSYYLPRANVYVSGAVLLARLEGNGSRTSLGPGLDLNVGKEWWISSNWGMGLTLQIVTARMAGDLTNAMSDSTWRTTGLGVVGSATFN